MTTKGWLFRIGAMLAIALLVVPALARATETLTFIHTDVAGSPVAATDQAGNLVWRESYRPYGERTKNQTAAASNRQFFHGKAFDADTGLSYFGARYYDPVVGRFMGVDPQGFDEKNLHSFNRYAYGNNNPYKFLDPDGRQSIPIPKRFLLPIFGVPAAGALGQAQRDVAATQNALRKALGIDKWTIFSETADDADKARNSDGVGNTNPYSGPVDHPVVVVDPMGNAIPVDKGQKVTTSPNGDYQQVRDKDGNETGVRLDRGGHKSHADPQAREPHAHVPGITTPNGNPHLPIKQP